MKSKIRAHGQFLSQECHLLQAAHKPYLQGATKDIEILLQDSQEAGGRYEKTDSEDIHAFSETELIL